MAGKNQTVDRELEDQILDDEALDGGYHTEPMDGGVLPADFENPPCGHPDHRCVDKRGRYQKGWKQLRIQRTDRYQADPQYVRAGDIGMHIPLEEWLDVPEDIIHALNDAMPTLYEQGHDENDALRNEHRTMRSRTIRRFSIDVLPSA